MTTENQMMEDIWQRYEGMTADNLSEMDKEQMEQLFSDFREVQKAAESLTRTLERYAALLFSADYIIQGGTEPRAREAYEKMYKWAEEYGGFPILLERALANAVHHALQAAEQGNEQAFELLKAFDLIHTVNISKN